jgi:alpha-L-fucosidase 2
MAEMLLQSQAGEIHLLPALPQAWAEGAVTGLKARGNVTIDMAWKEGKLTSAMLRSPVAAKATVRFQGRTQTVTLPAGQVVKLGLQ